MEQRFGYPQFDADGVKVLTRMDGVCSNMLMNITVHHPAVGSKLDLNFPGEEMAVLLVQGAITFAWGAQRKSVRRGDFFTDGAWCLHVPQGVPVTVSVEDESEILVQSTTNPRDFAPEFYTPENCRTETFGRGGFEGKAQRTVRTLFDHRSAPQSNMVLGETLTPQGGWASYPPHQHPQPEVYYYRFDKPQGFGASFIGDEVHAIRDGSFAALPGGACHPQVNAPGYPMYCAWMIRHFDNAPWTDRIFDPVHAWLLETK